MCIIPDHAEAKQPCTYLSNANAPCASSRASCCSSHSLLDMPAGFTSGTSGASDWLLSLSLPLLSSHLPRLNCSKDCQTHCPIMCCTSNQRSPHACWCLPSSIPLLRGSTHGTPLCKHALLAQCGKVPGTGQAPVSCELLSQPARHHRNSRNLSC